VGKKNLQILNIFFGGGDIGQKSDVSDVLICFESFHFIKCKDVFCSIVYCCGAWGVGRGAVRSYIGGGGGGSVVATDVGVGLNEKRHRASMVLGKSPKNPSEEVEAMIPLAKKNRFRIVGCSRRTA